MRTGLIVVLSTCVMAVSSGAALAADATTGGLEAGLGLTALTQSGSSSSLQPGFLVGGFGVVPVRSKAAVQPEFVLAQNNGQLTTAKGTFDEKLMYVKIPLLVRLTPSSDRTGFFVVAGPGFNFRTRARERQEGSTSEHNVKFQIPSFDISFIAGAGVSLGRFEIEARYDAGLKDQLKHLGPTKVADYVMAIADGPALKARAITFIGRLYLHL